MNDWIKFVLKFGCWGLGLLLVLIVLFALSGWGFEGYCYFYPSIGTQFAPGFSEEAFSKVQPGMSCTQVSNLLGAPLINTETRGVDEWYYSLDKASGPDFAWLVRIVESTNGVVVRVVKEVAYD